MQLRNKTKPDLYTIDKKISSFLFMKTHPLASPGLVVRLSLAFLTSHQEPLMKEHPLLNQTLDEFSFNQHCGKMKLQNIYGMILKEKKQGRKIHILTDFSLHKRRKIELRTNLHHFTKQVAQRRISNGKTRPGLCTQKPCSH